MHHRSLQKWYIIFSIYILRHFNLKSFRCYIGYTLSLIPSLSDKIKAEDLDDKHKDNIPPPPEIIVTLPLEQELEVATKDPAVTRKSSSVHYIRPSTSGVHGTYSSRKSRFIESSNRPRSGVLLEGKSEYVYDAKFWNTKRNSTGSVREKKDQGLRSVELNVNNKKIRSSNKVNGSSDA